MNSKEKALYYLEHSSCYKIPGYTTIDPLIEPLCNLLTEKGYITLHSCSSHPGSQQWYISFVATKSVKPLKNTILQIEKEHGFRFEFYNSHHPTKIVTRRWYFGTLIPSKYKFNEEYIEKFNKTIYEEIKKRLN